MAQVTIKDLAKLLNLSSSTVSRALCDHSDINKDTKTRVLEAAAKNEYRPNVAAKNLVGRCSQTIGVIVPEIRNTFFSTVVSGVEDIAYERGYSIIVCQSAETYKRELINLEAMRSNNVAGILISPSHETVSASHINEVQKQGTPVVLFDRILEGLEASSVVVDDFAGAHRAVSYLFDKGYTKIAYLSGSDTMYVSKKRKNGYLAAIQEQGIEVNPDYMITCGIFEEDGAKGAKQLMNLSDKPDAIFAFNDPVAIGALQYLRDTGVAIPGDVAVIGFTNNPEGEIITPKLTTIDQPALEIGRQAVKLLISKIEGDGSGNDMSIVLKTGLVVRESC